MQRLRHRAYERTYSKWASRALPIPAILLASGEPKSFPEGLGIAQTMTPLAWWLLLLPAIFIVVSILIFFKYRGWRGFVFLREGIEGYNSPFVERDFILSQYDAYKKYRVKMEEIIRLRGHVDASERRHDNVLRDLIATQQFETARGYLSAMIAHCKDVGDVDAEITYMTYLDKMKEFEAEAGESSPENRA